MAPVHALALTVIALLASGVAPGNAWLGVSLGELSKDLRAQLGRPNEIVSSSIGDLWRFDADGGDIALEVVVASDRVVNIAARLKAGKQSTLADPFGATFGMTPAALRALRGVPIATYDDGAKVAYGEHAGVRWFYAFDGGAISEIEESAPLTAPAQARVAADDRHDGSRIDRALLVNATTQSDADGAELAYLRGLQCERGGLWQVVGEETVPSGTGYFDLVHATCSTTKILHDFYFDVTSSFGK